MAGLITQYCDAVFRLRIPLPNLHINYVINYFSADYDNTKVYFGVYDKTNITY